MDREFEFKTLMDVVNQKTPASQEACDAVHFIAGTETRIMPMEDAAKIARKEILAQHPGIMALGGCPEDMPISMRPATTPHAAPEAPKA